MVELSCYKFIGVFISKQPEELGGNPKSEIASRRLTYSTYYQITQSVFCRSID